MEQRYAERHRQVWLVIKIILFGMAVLAVIYFGFFAKASLPRWLRQIGVNDLILHGLGFAVLSFIALVGVRRIWLILLLLFAFAAALEISQIVQPHRNVGFDDFVANLVGVGIGGTAAIAVNLFVGRRLQ